MHVAFMKYLDWILMNRDENNLVLNVKMYAHDIHFYLLIFFILFISSNVKFWPLASWFIIYRDFWLQLHSSGSFFFWNSSFFYLKDFTSFPIFHAGIKAFCHLLRGNWIILFQFFVFHNIVQWCMYLLSNLIIQDLKRQI